MQVGRIVITGSTGFIGSHLVGHILSKNRPVTVILRPDSDISRLKNFKGYNFVIEEDYSDPTLARKLIDQNCDYFVHCAWRGVSGNDRNNTLQVTENLPNTIKALELAAAIGCKGWISIGSQAEYGNLNKKIHEDCKPSPTTLYGKAKLSAGIASLGLCEKYGLRGSHLRIFSTYGPNDQEYRLIPYVINQFANGKTPQLTNCEQIWDYLHVEDAARAILAVICSGATGVMNLGSGRATSLKNIIKIISKEFDNMYANYGSVPYRPDQVMHLESDISRIKNLTGWSPMIPIEKGLADMAKEARSKAPSALDNFNEQMRALCSANFNSIKERANI